MLKIFLKFGKLSCSIPAWASHSWLMPSRPRTDGEYKCITGTTWIRVYGPTWRHSWRTCGNAVFAFRTTWEKCRGKKFGTLRQKSIFLLFLLSKLGYQSFLNHGISQRCLLYIFVVVFAYTTSGGWARMNNCLFTAQSRCLIHHGRIWNNKSWQ